MKGKILAITSLAHFINDGNTLLMPVIYSYILISLNLNSLIIGIISALFYIISAIASPL
jgi:FSR family fosmidomycin resistance protein-like MFS transporter